MPSFCSMFARCRSTVLTLMTSVSAISFDEILKLVAEGHTSKEIGELLFISAKTVERHRANLLQKLGMRDRLELTRYAIRAGLIEP